jgi:hypothetical protein
MGKKTFKKHQKLYRMKGCSKKKNKSRKQSKKSRRFMSGGSNSFLAYTGQPIVTQTNPFLAYTGKGGRGGQDNIQLPAEVDVMSPKSMSNLYGANPSLPNTGPINIGRSTIPTNMGSNMRGGNCGGTCSLNMTGGNCGCSLLSGGKKQNGGKTIDPQGLLGQPWGVTPAKWPGVDGISGNRNYLPYNNLKVDPKTALISVGPNPPFLFGGRKKRVNRGTKKRRQRGGNISNFISQDLVNLGRQVQLGFGTAYNGLNGYPAPRPVLPWQGQLVNTPNLNTIKGAAI